MLKEWKELDKPGEEELKLRLDAAKEKLARQQLLIKEQKIPVLVVMEGWGTSGKGYSIGQIIQNYYVITGILKFYNCMASNVSCTACY